MSTGWTDEQYLSKISAADVKFDVHKLTSEQVAKLYGTSTRDGVTGFFSGTKLVDFGKFQLRINACGSWLRFIQVEGKMKLKEANFCTSPNCPMCQWRRSLKWRAKFLTLLPEIQKNYPSHKWVFLTLTIRNCDLYDLRPTLTHLNDAFNRLSKLSIFPMDGLVKSVEVTRIWDCYHNGTYLGRHGTKWIMQWEYQNKAVLDLKSTNEVHPHLHITGLVHPSYFTGRGYIKQEEWRELWKQCLRVEYLPVVNIKAVKPKTKAAKLLPEPEQFAENPQTADESGLVQAICETLKYTVKEQDLVGTYCQDDDINSSWLKAITQQLYKTRKVEYRGVLKQIGKQLEAAVNDGNLVNINEDTELTEQPLEDLEFRWNRAIKKYVLFEKVDWVKSK